MWMRHRMFYAPTRTWVSNGCTTTVSISTGSTDWGLSSDHLSQDYTLIFCLHRSYRFHYRLSDASEYCVFLQPGTVIGFLGGVFEHKLDLVPRSESGERYSDDEAYVFTCYTSREQFGEGGVYPTPHPEMHIHKLAPKSDADPKVRLPVATTDPVDHARLNSIGRRRRDSSGSPAVQYLGATEAPRSSKRLKTDHTRNGDEVQRDPSLLELLQRSQPENPAQHRNDRPQQQHINSHGKMYLRPATDVFTNSPEQELRLDPNTAVRRCLWELDPLCWPKYTILHFPKAFGRKKAEPLVEQLSRFAKVRDALLRAPADFRPI